MSYIRTKDKLRLVSGEMIRRSRLETYFDILKVDEDTSTLRGDDCSVSCSRGSTTTYYVRVKLVGSYTVQGHPGDWYDISIDIYPS